MVEFHKYSQFSDFWPWRILILGYFEPLGYGVWSYLSWKKSFYLNLFGCGVASIKTCLCGKVHKGAIKTKSSKFHIITNDSFQIIYAHWCIILRYEEETSKSRCCIFFSQFGVVFHFVLRPKSHSIVKTELCWFRNN